MDESAFFRFDNFQCQGYMFFMGIKNIVKLKAIVCLILFVITVGNVSSEGMKFHIRAPESSKDHRLDFVYELIKTILDKTISTYGPYELKPIPKMVFKRISTEKTQNQFPNLIIRLSGDIYTGENFEVVPIPINRGIVGYRLFLIHKSMVETFQKISGFSELLSEELRAGQGRWTDVEILEENGVKVVVGNNYEGLFCMLMRKRFEFFPRGTNEIFLEYEMRKSQFPDLVIENSIALYYPLPRVLVTNKGNKPVARRIEQGLKKIFSDGTHRKLWLKYNREWVEKANLDKRKIFSLKNSIALPYLPYDQKAFWYHPGEKM